MTRRRIKPPLGIPISPSYVTSEQRKAEILNEFLRRLDYVFASYRLALTIPEFNKSLAKLKLRVGGGRRTGERGDRLHPLLEIVVNHHARRLAQERTGRADAPITQPDVERAALWVADNIEAERGRPRANQLDHHVGGLMALIQQTCGQLVIERRHKESGEYAPRLEGPARTLLLLKSVNPTITETQLVNKVGQIRREYAGKVMRFRDFYPLYGATLGDGGVPQLAGDQVLERFEPSIPIYCP